MRIVLFNWRDSAHPRAGGAERYTHDLLLELTRQGHECTLFASHAPGLQREQDYYGYKIVRAGTELTCRFYALAWLHKHREAIDLVVDEVNTLPFLSRLVFPKATVLLIHQLAREVWWKEAPFLLALIGFALEPLMLQIYRGARVITISKSSLRSFGTIGFGRGEIIECALDGPRELTECERAHIGYVGRVTPSKRVHHVIRAFAEIAGAEPSARLTLVGRGPERYLRSLHKLVKQLGVEGRVTFAGFVPTAERDRLMSSFTCLLVTSLREGWGLVVSEAAAYGVPSVAYSVPGLSDSVRDRVSGLLVPSGDWKALAQQALELIRDPELRATLSLGGRELLSQYSRDVFAGRVAATFQNYAGALTRDGRL